jgi:hypothetical protein
MAETVARFLSLAQAAQFLFMGLTSPAVVEAAAVAPQKTRRQLLLAEPVVKQEQFLSQHRAASPSNQLLTVDRQSMPMTAALAEAGAPWPMESAVAAVVVAHMVQQAAVVLAASAPPHRTLLAVAAVAVVSPAVVAAVEY